MDGAVNSEPSGFVIALILTLVFGGALTFIGVAATLLARRQRHMSSRERTARSIPDTNAVHVPIPPNSTPADTGTDDDITMPRISRRLSDSDVITLLAVQRTLDGKYRFSANQITIIIGGKREDVLAQVRAIRDAPRFPSPAGGTEPASYPVSGREAVRR